MTRLCLAPCENETTMESVETTSVRIAYEFHEHFWRGKKEYLPRVPKQPSFSKWFTSRPGSLPFGMFLRLLWIVRKLADRTSANGQEAVRRILQAIADDHDLEVIPKRLGVPAIDPVREHLDVHTSVAQLSNVFSQVIADGRIDEATERPVLVHHGQRAKLHIDRLQHFNASLRREARRV